MPYITQEQRGLLNRAIIHLGNILRNRIPEEDLAGALNYAITKLLLQLIPEKYKDFNMLVGVLESVKLEFYRRKVVPYENMKKAMNGDIK